MPLSAQTIEGRKVAEYNKLSLGSRALATVFNNLTEKKRKENRKKDRKKLVSSNNLSHPELCLKPTQEFSAILIIRVHLRNNLVST